MHYNDMLLRHFDIYISHARFITGWMNSSQSSCKRRLRQQVACRAIDTYKLATTDVVRLQCSADHSADHLEMSSCRTCSSSFRTIWSRFPFMCNKSLRLCL